MGHDDVIAEFRAAMEAAGLATRDEIVGDGRRRRITIEGDKRGDPTGWYVLHIDERPAGQFGSWRDADIGPDGKHRWHSWTAKNTRPFSGEERKEFEARVKRERREAEEEQARAYLTAAEDAKVIWDALEDAKTHPYLTRKAIKPHGARISKDLLVIPVWAGPNQLSSLQYIDAHGGKTFMKGGRTAGCYFTIAKAPPTDTILVCEGFATGASLHQATELPVVVAFNAGNLLPVAKTMRAKFPKARMVLCADNDQWTHGNPGVSKAEAAAFDVGGVILIPAFKALREGMTDFNDLAVAEGLEEVARQIEPAIAKFTVPEELSTPLPIVVEPPPAVPARPRFVFRIKDWPITNRKGDPIPCIENVAHLLRQNGIHVRYDVIRKDLDVRIPHEHYLIDTAKNDQMTRIVSVCQSAGIKESGLVRGYVAHIASQNPHNPVAEWVTSTAWDGQTRLPDFFETVIAKGEPDSGVRAFKETLLKRWMLSAIAAAFRPTGVSAHGVLVFKGEQYLGKTKWFKSLVPEELQLIRDGMLLDPKDRDSVYQVVSNWIVELGELDATFRRADIAQLKSFLTKDKDTVRLPYAHAPASFARRTVFFGSVNPDDYLNDPTGNRRFWTIDCEHLHHSHGLDMQQVWAEFLALFQGGESWYLSHDELMQLNAHNRDFEVISPVEEMVRTRYPWGEPNLIKEPTRPMTATDVALELGLRNPTVKDKRDIARALREITGKPPVKNDRGRFYDVPELKFQFRPL